MFEIAPIVEKRFKRGHFYDSYRNFHKINRRFITDDLSTLEFIHPEDDLIDYVIVPGMNLKLNDSLIKIYKPRNLSGRKKKFF